MRMPPWGPIRMAQSQSGDPDWEAWLAVSKRFSASSQNASMQSISDARRGTCGPISGYRKLAQNLLHVADGLGNLGPPAALLHALGAGIVSSQSQRRVAAKTRQQLLEEAGARRQALGRIEGVVYAQFLGRGRHQLHQAHGALWRNGAGAEAGLLLGHRAQQIGVQALLLRGVLDQGSQLDFRQRLARRAQGGPRQREEGDGSGLRVRPVSRRLRAGRHRRHRRALLLDGNLHGRHRLPLAGHGGVHSLARRILRRIRRGRRARALPQPQPPPCKFLPRAHFSPPAGPSISRSNMLRNAATESVCAAARFSSPTSLTSFMVTATDLGAVIPILMRDSPICMIWISISSPMSMDSPARRRITSMRPRATAIPPGGSGVSPSGWPAARAGC